MKFCRPVCILFWVMVASFCMGQTNTDEQLAIQFFNNKEYDKAAELFEKLFSKKNNAYYYIYYVQTLIELGDKKKAEKFVKKQQKDNPDDIKYQVDLGYIHLSDDPSKAKDIFENAIKNQNGTYQQAVDLANAFLIRRQTEYAVKSYIEARKTVKMKPAFNMELAYIYESLGRFEEMTGEMLDLLEQNPSSVQSIQYYLQNSLSNDPEGKKNEALRIQLLRRVQKNPDGVYLSEMLYWLLIQQKEFDQALTQAKSLDKRLNEHGDRISQLASISISNKSYEVATKAYEYLIQKGSDHPYYLNSKIQLLNTRFLKLSAQISRENKEWLSLEKDYLDLLQELGYSAMTLDLVKNLGHLEAFYLNHLTQATDVLQKAIELHDVQPQQIAGLKLELGDILLFSDEVWDASLMYSQVEKAFPNEPIGHEAKFRNARLSYFIGEFDWAQAQLDVLKASTSKLIANDAMEMALLISENRDDDSTTTGLLYYAHADLLLYRHQDLLALKTLDSVGMLGLSHPLNDEVLYKKAQIMMNRGAFESADSLLAKLIEFYSDGILGDDALFASAQLNEFQLNNKAKAMELYNRLFTLFPGSLYATDARKNFRRLRGDVVE